MLNDSGIESGRTVIVGPDSPRFFLNSYNYQAFSIKPMRGVKVLSIKPMWGVHARRRYFNEGF